MKIILAIILISVNIGLCDGLKFSGDTSYQEQTTKKLITSNNIEHLFKIHEDHKYIVSISNTVNVDLDCFNNEIKETNVFTTLKIEF